MLEVHENPAKILGILFHPVVLPLNLRLLEEPQYLLLERPGTLAGDDFDQGNALFDGFPDDAMQGGIDVPAVVEDVVEIEFEFGHVGIVSREYLVREMPQ